MGDDATKRAVALGTALMSTLIVQGLTDYTYWIPTNVLLVLWGGQIILRKPAEKPKLRGKEAIRYRIRLAMIIIIGFVVCMATLAIDTQSSIYMLWTTVLGCGIAYLLYVISSPACINAPSEVHLPD
jgi:hypothetical protein